MANLRTTLETGLPVVRNKNAGHGQGSAVTPISDEFAEYALNLAATNIVYHMYNPSYHILFSLYFQTISL